MKRAIYATLLASLVTASWLGEANAAEPGASPDVGGASVAQTSPADAPPERLFADSARALEQGAHTEAIDQLELLADRGFVHPDASFNRGVAYLGRARGATARPGDYGRAIAGFSEALALRPEDSSAADALATARG